VAEINKGGGIFLKDLGKRLPVRVKAMDTESNPTKAAEVATKLILQDKVDLMLSMGTPDTVNPVDAICERYQVPAVSSVAPIEPWLTGGPYKWSYHFFWGLGDIITVFTGMWGAFADKTNKVVGGFWPNDPDGAVWAVEFGKALKNAGYRVVDVGRFPYGMQDFSGFISTWKKEKVQILTGVPSHQTGPHVGGSATSRDSFPRLPPSERRSYSPLLWRRSAEIFPMASLLKSGGPPCIPLSHP
jgi:branched-chain amino acid transport system substrate-binding protein